MASKVHLLASKIHKWIALIVGLQFLAWTTGGLVMTWLPIGLVRGEGNVAEVAAPVLSTDQVSRLAALHGDIQSLKARRLGGHLAAEVRTPGGLHLLDAETGQSLSPLSRDHAVAVAKADFSGKGDVAGATLLKAQPVDYRGPLPVWQVAFADADNTRLYVSPTEGRVVARRNAYWRVYDFFWMLHIMDYQGREDFNHPLVMAAALSAVLFALSGFVLIYHRFHRRDFGLKRRRAP
ncbi:PepSY domain-containing protein [Kordiimonas marina]|uniref:PepSY domain-containing protein n=1 Tax=Kordiimonas marina TaxID=2872312 RepID=UPI001FF173EC|nr:PepSY domain-containing protein [Kordiimonas marina]MCJ9427698.1 PepSY domain-containing protein [Kordiimonas marina]